MGNYGRGKASAPKRGRVPCEVTGCTGFYWVKGLCQKHYDKKRKLKRKHVPKPGYNGPVPADWRKNADGYIVKQYVVNGKSTVFWQHREVMSEYLRRPLLKHENVHHINGVRDDNRLSNLELWSTSQPKGQRVTDKLAWAREILALYGNERGDND